MGAGWCTSRSNAPCGRWAPASPRAPRPIWRHVRLDRPGAAPIPLALDLPGQTGQPVFALDGRSLYVVQFFTDSNADGVIDASDSGVLFRVPFAAEREDAPELAAASSPDQLTSESWSCEYPAPAAASLIATCSRDHSLDVYQLPLDGQVPSNWDVPRLNEELGMVGRRADQLLLYRQRLLREARPKPRRLLMMRLSQLHLAFEDFDAAEFYARHMPSVEDPATAGLAEPLRILIDHRRAMKERDRGRMVDELSDAERQRMAALDPAAAPSPPSAVFQHVVRSELAEAAGDFTLARQELEAAQVTDTTPRAVLEAWFERADALYRELDDREALVEAGRRLSMNKAFHDDDQLDFARAAVRALYRGRPYDEADAAMAQALASAPAGSAYAFALELGRHVNALHDERPPRPVRDALIAFYHQQKDPLRRRALVQDAVERAAGLGADGVLEALATVYVDDAPPGTEERRRAERLFRRAMMGRAYRRLGRQRLDDARADFDLVTQRTGSLESAVESMSLRLRAGVSPEVVEKEVTTTSAKMARPLAHFVKAYLMARQLPKLDDRAHAQAVAAAVKELRASWQELKNQRAVHALYGAIQHEDFLRGHDPSAAERANRHYLIALDLVRNNVRYRAMILGALGLLHTQVGNFHIALGYLDATGQVALRGQRGGAGGVPCPRPGAPARRPRGGGRAGGGSGPGHGGCHTEAGQVRHPGTGSRGALQPRRGPVRACVGALRSRAAHRGSGPPRRGGAAQPAGGAAGPLRRGVGGGAAPAGVGGPGHSGSRPGNPSRAGHAELGTRHTPSTFSAPIASSPRDCAPMRRPGSGTWTPPPTHSNSGARCSWNSSPRRIAMRTSAR